MIFFCAGFFFPQKLGAVEYFKGCRDAFPDAKFPPVPTLASVDARAIALADEIADKCPNGPVHLIAHSMAGLDARRLLTLDLRGLGGRIKSLSTIATPHNGSPIADLLVGPAPGLLSFRRIAYEGAVATLNELHHDIGALGDLSSDKAAAFNTANPDRQSIRYFCYAGSKIESWPLRALDFYIHSAAASSAEAENDGLVTVSSASRHPLAEAPWPTDHFGEIGHHIPPGSSTFDHIVALRGIIARANAE